MSDNNEIIDNQEDNKQINNIISSTKNSIFKNLYKNLKVEISEKVMNKLLIKVDKLEKENELLKNENKSLKNHLIYLLRKILLNKAEYSKIRNNVSRDVSQASLLSKSKIKTTTLLCSNKCLEINNSYCGNNPIYKNIENQRFSTVESTRNKSIDNKISLYLNSIYRHNFSTNNSGLSIEKCLNMKGSVFEDIMGDIKKMNEIPKNSNGIKSNITSYNLFNEKNNNRNLKKNNLNKLQHFPTMRNKICIKRKNRKINEKIESNILNTENSISENDNKITKEKKNINIKDNKTKKMKIKSKILNNKITFKSPYLTNKY